MGRDIVKNLKFKKHAGKHFDPEKFAQLLDESYRNTKRADGLHAALQPGFRVALPRGE